MQKDLEVLVDDEFNKSQQCDFAAKTNNGCCIRKNIASRLREVIFLLYLAWMRPHVECCVQFWDPQYRKDMELLDQV